MISAVDKSHNLALFTMLDYSRLNHTHVLCSFPLRVVVCDPPCENGACVSNDTCSCSTGFEGERCTDAGNRGKEMRNGNWDGYYWKMFWLVDQPSLHLPLFYAVSTECDQVLNPCGNGGNCTQFGSTVLCQCLPDFTGMFCEQGEHPQPLLLTEFFLLFLTASYPNYGTIAKILKYCIFVHVSIGCCSAF